MDKINKFATVVGALLVLMTISIWFLRISGIHAVPEFTDVRMWMNVVFGAGLMVNFDFYAKAGKWIVSKFKGGVVE